MQPRLLAILVVVVPLLAVNIAYLMSASAGHVAWCLPYIDGCTTISQAGRSGDTIFFFRAAMMVYSVLLIWFWAYTLIWLNSLTGQPRLTSRILCFLGVVGAIFLLIYIDYLGTSGEFQNFMRRTGILVYFTLTPLAQLLKLKLLFNMEIKTDKVPMININVLQFQLTILLLMLAMGITSILLGLANMKTYEIENVIEWNFSLLIILYFTGTISLWKKIHLQLIRH